MVIEYQAPLGEAFNPRVIKHPKGMACFRVNNREYLVAHRVLHFPKKNPRPKPGAVCWYVLRIRLVWANPTVFLRQGWPNRTLPPPGRGCV